MKRLHHRHIALKRRVKHRRTYHRQRIVDVHDIDPVLPDQTFDLADGPQRINRRKRKQELSGNPAL